MVGIKKEMTATYDSRGRRVGATVVSMTPNFVTQVNANSIQLGIGTSKSVKKPQIGHGKKAGLETPIRYFREVEKGEGDLQPGTAIALDQVFSIGDSIKVQGTSKGKGFQGGVRRHGFHGGPKTHGQSDRLRAPGAIGSGTTPGRVYKGKKMAGHMGMDRVSIKNLEIVGIDKANSLLVIKGGIPGPVGSLVMITKLGRTKGYTPPPEEKPSEEEEAEQAKEAEVTEEKPIEEAPKEGEQNAG